MTSSDARRNRLYWEREADAYQRRHGGQLDGGGPAWGVWSIPERELGVLGSVRGLDVLELGCGAAHWSAHLRRAGARPVAVDLSARQLAYASSVLVDGRLVQADAVRLPFGDGSFDVVFSDHGALSYTDPEAGIPEAARVLRPGGLLAFNIATPLVDVCWNSQSHTVGVSLRRSYFGLRRLRYEEHVAFQLPYGEWIRLFGRCALDVEDLLELRPPPGARTTYRDFVPLGWARRWPAEHIWKVRRRDERDAAVAIRASSRGPSRRPPG